MKTLIFFSLFTIVNSFDVIGWFIGENLTTFNLSDIRYDLYSHIRIGSIKVDKNGIANCNDNDLMNEAISYIKNNNTKITIHSEVDIEQCAFNNITSDYCNTYFETLPKAINDCGPYITNMEFDYEWGLHLDPLGFIKKGYMKKFSQFLDKTQKIIGDNYTVSCDVSVYLLPYTKWVDSEIFDSNPNLFVNIMSYYWPKDCSILPWKYDAWVIHNEWGIRKSQINIGIGYFYLNRTKLGKIYNQLNYNQYINLCPNNIQSDCYCNNLGYVSPDMNFYIGQHVKKEGYRGIFPWAADFDDKNHPLIVYATDGLAM